MNLNQIIAFCAVVKAGSISKAAKHLHLTQPALSVQIQDLEDYFQTKLLERTNKGVNPTAAGEVVFSYGQRITSLSENLFNEINTQKNVNNDLLAIGASTTIGGYALPCSIYAFREKYPKSIVKLTIGNTREIIEKTEDGIVDVGLVEGPIPENTLQGKLIGKNICIDELVLITSDNNNSSFNITSGDFVTLEELRNLPLILREEGSGIRETIEKALGKNNVFMEELKIFMELNTIEAIKSSVEAGQGVSILSRLAIRKELRHESLKALKVEGISFAHNFTVIYSDVKPKTPVQKTFLDFIKCPRTRSFC